MPQAGATLRPFCSHQSMLLFLCLSALFVGQRARSRIEPVAFRRWFFIATLLVGSFMVAKGLTAQ